LETWIGSSDFALWKIEFIWQLRNFKNRLLRHFDFEEESGFFLNLPVVENRKGSLGKKIHREHRVLIHELERILRNLKKLKNAADPNIESIQSDILILIGEINIHENEEMNLIQSMNPDPIKQLHFIRQEGRINGGNRKI
jgi:hypothetical protein